MMNVSVAGAVILVAPVAVVIIVKIPPMTQLRP